MGAAQPEEGTKLQTLFSELLIYEFCKIRTTEMYGELWQCCEGVLLGFLLP